MRQKPKKSSGNTYLVSVAEKHTMRHLTKDTYLVTLAPNVESTHLSDVMHDDFGFDINGRTNYVDYVKLDDYENPYTCMLNLKSLLAIQEKARQTLKDFNVSPGFDKPILEYISNSNDIFEIHAICSEIIGDYIEATDIRKSMAYLGYAFKDTSDIINNSITI
jgi:hypothetical protein